MINRTAIPNNKCSVYVISVKYLFKAINVATHSHIMT